MISEGGREKGEWEEWAERGTQAGREAGRHTGRATEVRGVVMWRSMCSMQVIKSAREDKRGER